MEYESQPQEPELLPPDELINMAVFVEDISGTAEECAENLTNLLKRNNAKLPVDEMVYIEGYVKNREGEWVLTKDILPMTEIFVTRDETAKPRLLARCLVGDETEGSLHYWKREQEFVTFFITDMQQITDITGISKEIESRPDQVPAKLDHDLLRDCYRDLVTSSRFSEEDDRGKESLMSDMIDMVTDVQITHGSLELECQYFMLDHDHYNTYEPEIREEEVRIIGHSIGITHGSVSRSGPADHEYTHDKDLMIVVRTSSDDESKRYDEGDIIFIPIHQKMKITPRN